MLALALWVIGLFTWIVIAHAIADLAMQPRAWATTKHSNWVSLAKHVGLYTLTSWMITFGLTAAVGIKWSVIYWLGNGLLHFLLDAVTSRGNWHAWTRAQALEPGAEKNKYMFHAIAWICVDQIVHIWTLACTLILLLTLTG